MKQIEEQAFANVKATTVVIPETCTTIGENALANSRVRTVYIPSSVLTIEETAFEGCERIAFVTPLDSHAASFAMDHGMLLVEP